MQWLGSHGLVREVAVDANSSTWRLSDLGARHLLVLVSLRSMGKALRLPAEIDIESASVLHLLAFIIKKESDFIGKLECQDPEKNIL